MFPFLIQRIMSAIVALCISMTRGLTPIVKLIAYDDERVFTELQAEWNVLLRRSTCDNIFSTWEWQSSWWTAYEAGALWVIACRDDQDRLVAVAPWFIETQPGGERVVRSIGCVDVTDYVDVIVEPGYTRQVYSALAQQLLDESERYDRVNLCNIPEESPTRTEFPSVLKSCGFDVEVVEQEVCPVIILPRDFEDYLARLDKKQRHEIRRKMRRAESEARSGRPRG